MPPSCPVPIARLSSKYVCRSFLCPCGLSHRRSGAGQHDGGPDGRPGPDRQRTGLRRRGDAADRKQPSGQADRGRAVGGGAPGAPPLLPAGRAGGGGGAGAAHPPDAQPAGAGTQARPCAPCRRTAPGAHVLRPSGRAPGRRHHRLPGEAPLPSPGRGRLSRRSQGPRLSRRSRGRCRGGRGTAAPLRALLPGLERAPPAPRRCLGGGACRTPGRRKVVEARPQVPQGNRHGGGRGRPSPGLSRHRRCARQS